MHGRRTYCGLVKQSGFSPVYLQVMKLITASSSFSLSNLPVLMGAGTILRLGNSFEIWPLFFSRVRVRVNFSCWSSYKVISFLSYLMGRKKYPCFPHLSGISHLTLVSTVCLYAVLARRTIFFQCSTSMKNTMWWFLNGNISKLTHLWPEVTTECDWKAMIALKRTEGCTVANPY